MFSGFSAARFQLGKFRKERWGPCREPQEFTLLVHRTLSAAYYAKKKLVIPSLPVYGRGELAASVQGALEIFRDFFPLLYKDF